MRKHTTQISSLLVVAALLFASVLQFLTINNASAAQITNRSLTLVGVGSDGGSKPSGIVNHSFQFDMPIHDTGEELGSIAFEYCTTAADTGALTCVAPTGLSLNNEPATLGTVSGVATGFTKNVGASTDNRFVIGRASASTVAAGTENVLIQAVENPSTPNETFFVRISTYTSLDGTGTPIHQGNVAASTANPILLQGTMPESLIFCTADIIGVSVGDVPDCSTALNGTILFDRLFSPIDTATATSQMAASTNAGSGYVITVNGTTLTSGGNTITGMDDGGAAEALSLGNSQFGLNLVANTTTLDIDTNPLGADPSLASNGTNYKANPATNYNTADLFRYVDGEPVAQSDNGGLGASDGQIYTVSYVVNVPGSQPAGTYTSTLTYICTPTY